MAKGSKEAHQSVRNMPAGTVPNGVDRALTADEIKKQADKAARDMAAGQKFDSEVKQAPPAGIAVTRKGTLIYHEE